VCVVFAVAATATIGTGLDCSSRSNLDDYYFIVYFDDCASRVLAAAIIGRSGYIQELSWPSTIGFLGMKSSMRPFCQ
jgi:hypothetical protein